MTKSRSKSVEGRPTGDGSLEICLLGPFQVVVDGRVVNERRWTRRKPALLLKLLALQPHHQLHREQIIELFWPDSDPEAGNNNLHKAIHLARHALEPDLKSAADSRFIKSRGQHVQLSTSGNLYIDVDEFERVAEAAIKTENLAACETAIGLYRGDLLKEDAYQDWVALRREQLRELYHRLLGKLSQIYESQGEAQQSIELLRRLITTDTANEQAHRDLMRLYALDGSRHRALRQYQQCVESLRKELDADPEPATVELCRQIESGQIPRRAIIETSDAIESIAILPFLNTSADPELEYLSDGITENIIDNLSRLAALRVMAWGTVARFKETEITPAEIGRSLGVRLVLTGRMLQRNERLIIRAELIDAADGAHLWGEAYDRDVTDIFAMQADLAREISRNLRLKLTGEQTALLARRHTESPVAYQQYLKGRYFWYKRTEQDLRKGIDYFNRAIEEDPGYAAAHAGLSDSYALLALRGIVPHQEAFKLAKAAARKALEIDDSLGEARASLAHIRLHEWDWAGLNEEFTRALKLNPGHSIAYQWYSEYLTAMGRTDESIEMIERAKEIDPLSPITWAGMAGRLYFARRYDEAIEQIQEGLEINRNHFMLHMSLGNVYVQIGRSVEAITKMQHAVSLSGSSTEALAGLARACAAAGSSREARKILAELTDASAKHYVSPYNLAKIYASLEEEEQAFVWLEKAYQERHPDFIELKVEPVLDNLRDDSRFADLLRRVGFE
ncbi:MAG TPA: BTAD domain-containing putative transcriptional regulator [Pyrinomonadaceae bacterium]|nr:BTAD domain-containing putative transcriptional regulator [Pyrinomonadaceae bacterium]